VIALDRACASLQLSRIAARGVFALGRVGASYGHGSGDYGLALSAVHSDTPRILGPGELDLVFTAVLESVEEAVLDALIAAETVRTPHGRTAFALPHEVLTV
ncbi:P1 family peptidase, partial [Streptosporangium algeriense]